LFFSKRLGQVVAEIGKHYEDIHGIEMVWNVEDRCQVKILSNSKDDLAGQLFKKILLPEALKHKIGNPSYKVDLRLFSLL
jgi:hypothetical protein